MRTAPDLQVNRRVQRRTPVIIHGCTPIGTRLLKRQHFKAPAAATGTPHTDYERLTVLDRENNISSRKFRGKFVTSNYDELSRGQEAVD